MLAAVAADAAGAGRPPGLIWAHRAKQSRAKRRRCAKTDAEEERDGKEVGGVRHKGPKIPTKPPWCLQQA